MLSRFVPPVIAALLRKESHASGQIAAPLGPAADGRLPDWEAAEDTDEIWTAGEGWAHKSVVATQVAAWDTIVRSIEKPRPFGQFHGGTGAGPDVSTHNTIITFGYALARASLRRERLSLLDWGGAVGHYFGYARQLLPRLKFDYVVKDLEQFCEAGRKLAAGATFVSDERRALSRDYDFVFVSASAQYSRDFYGLLRNLCDCAREWLMITRLPIVETSDDFVVVQRPHAYGYMTEYACWYINRRRFLDCITSHGFSLEREFVLGDAAHVVNAPEVGRYAGFLFRRARAASE
jgi:putative methyltransferase (TIGR04325 family)